MGQCVRRGRGFVITLVHPIFYKILVRLKHTKTILISFIIIGLYIKSYGVVVSHNQIAYKTRI